MKLFYVIDTQKIKKSNPDIIRKVALIETLSSSYGSCKIETELYFSQIIANCPNTRLALFNEQEILILNNIKDNKIKKYDNTDRLKGMNLRYFDNLFVDLINVEIKELVFNIF